MKDRFFRDFHMFASQPIALSVFDLLHMKISKGINRLALPYPFFARET